MNKELRKEIASLKLHAWLNSISIILLSVALILVILLNR